MKPRWFSSPFARRRGAALLIVLMSLAVLFSLGVPFLFASRIRSEAASETYDRSRARIAVDSASKVTAFHEAFSHPSMDSTPLWDAPAEWNGSVLGVLPQSLGEDWLSSTESWGAEIESVQASVSLATAPAMLLQNLIHPCFLSADASHGDSELQVTSTEGFPDSGFLWINAKWVAYGGRESSKFTLVQVDPEAPEDLDQVRFRSGFEVQDPRVQALVSSRFQTGAYHGPEFFGDLLNFNFGNAEEEVLPELDKQRLQTFSALRSGAYGTAQWEPAGWMTRAVDPEQPQIITINDASLFNTGTVVRIIPEDDETNDSVDRLVLAANGGRLLLSAPVPSWYTPFRTRIHSLRREPIDINACRPEILMALVTGVAFQGEPPVTSDSTASGSPGREWVSPAEASTFATRVLRERPLQGPSDLWRRVLAPLAEEGGLTDVDAWAIYVNSMDPNNGTLRQSTTSFGYRSGNVYQHRVNAAIRSRLGRTLARASYREEISAAPSGSLMGVVNTQESFEDFGRWARGLHGVSTLPNTMGTFTQEFGQRITAPTLQMGTLVRPGLMLPEPDFEVSAVIPTPARETDTFPNSGEGFTEHFDFETSPLGRDIHQAGAYNRPLEEWRVGGGNNISNIEPLHFQGWFRANNLATGNLFDLSGFETDRNRISVALEGNELVVRCWGTTGEDLFDPFGDEEAIIQRLDFADYALSDRWFHISVTLRNQSARGMQVCIDGVPRGEIDGFTHLTQAMGAFVAAPGGEIFVESTAGFPTRGVLRIGNELIDYSAKTAQSFIFDWDPAQYIGGRSLREATDDLALYSGSTHPNGAGVELYGYSALLLNNLPPGGHTLSGKVGPWSIATAVKGVDMVSAVIFFNQLELGKGINASYVGELELAPLQRFDSADPYYAEAFQEDGGYALLFQGRWGLKNADDESRVGGWEIIRYSARTGTTLTVSERNVSTPGMAAAPQGVYSATGNSFIMEPSTGRFIYEGAAVEDNHLFDVYIMPISMKTTGATDLSYAVSNGRSQVVQISAVGDPGNTEWVRYDHILNSCFLRDDWGAMRAAHVNLMSDLEDPDFEPPTGPGPSNMGVQILAALDAVAEKSVAATPSQDPVNPWETRPTIGELEPNRTADVAGKTLNQRLKDFQFRGVMGTFDHQHQAGDRAVPVFTTFHSDSNVNSSESRPGLGYLGRLDRVALLEGGSITSAPHWHTVQWASPARENEDQRLERFANYVAFEDFSIPLAGPDLATLVADPNFINDWRQLTRISKFPNQERPANLANFVVGGDTSGSGPEFDGLVDEVSLHTVGGMGNPQSNFARAALILTEDLDSGSASRLMVSPSGLSLDGRSWAEPNSTLGQYLGVLPQSGLVDIDGERIAYNLIDTQTGEITIAPNGRGLMGTQSRGHGIGTRVWMVDGRAAVALEGSMDAHSESLPISNGNGFSLSGTVLLDEELVHAPMRGLGFFGMPRTRARSGEREEVSTGLLRGRFGTHPEQHADGTVAISFPNRWMDNYMPQSNHGAGAWLQIGFEEPQALWQTISYQTEIPDNSITVRALIRSGLATWEDDPEITPGMRALQRGTSASGGALPLGLRSDRLDLRIMFDWGVGAFDAITFLPTAWTMEPRLRNLMVEYYATSRVQRSQEVVE